MSYERGRRGPSGHPPEPIVDLLRRWSVKIARDVYFLARFAGRIIAISFRTAWAYSRVLQVFLHGRWTARRERQRALATRRQGTSELPAGAARRGEVLGGPVTLVARRDDDLSSLIGRIDTASDIEIVLFVPRQARALREATVWAHVAAHVRRRGLSLGVVSPRGDVRAHARANVLRAARSPGGLRRGPWRLRFGSREFLVPRPQMGTLTRGVLLVVAVVFAGVTACYMIPSAQIVVVPRSEPFSLETQVRLQPLLQEPDLELGLIPAISVEREIATTLTTIPTKGVESEGSPATLVLRFVSEGGMPLEVPASTMARTSAGVVFLTDRPVTVPSGGSADVMATAQFSGIEGNVGLGVVDLLGEELPGTLSVTNAVPGEGGTDVVVVPVVSQEDVDRLRDLARSVLARAGTRELIASVRETTVFPETVVSQILSEQPQSLLGDATEVFVMDYTALASGLALTDATASAFGRLLLVDGLPEGMALLPDTVETEIVPTTKMPDGTEASSRTVIATLRATGRIYILPDLEPLRGQLTGVRPDVAANRLMVGLGLEELPQVTLGPEWIPWWWMPRRASQITIGFAALLKESEDPYVRNESARRVAGR